MHLVIAHYKEDLAWLEPLLAAGHTALIYEKGGGTRGPALKNEGRESGTWLHYLVTEYGKFPEHVAFLQGDPIAHCQNLAEELARPREFANLGHWITTSDHDGAPHEGQCAVGPVHVEFVGPFPGQVDFAVGGQFLASRARLQSRPLAWWKKLQVRHDTMHKGPWTLERCWPSLLQGPFRL